MNLMNLRVRKANPSDLASVVDLLNDAGARLEMRGIGQWGATWMTPDRMEPLIRSGETFIVDDVDRHQPAATVTLTNRADLDFWTPEEAQQPALYLSKLARCGTAPPGVGTWTLDWAVTHAAHRGYPRVRLDAWATNQKLHEYYTRRGWAHIRTQQTEGRQSGALFERLTF